MTKSAFATPDRASAMLYVRLLVQLSVLFVLVYGGCNWLSAQRESTWGMYTQWELAIPFVPSMVFVYFSISALFWLPMFCLSPAQMRALARVFALATVIGGICFLLMPGHLGHTRPTTVPDFAAVYAAMYQLDLSHNLVPSLHIAYSSLIVWVIASALAGCAQGRLWTLLLQVWLALIGASVLLVHQHHLLDVLAGLALGRYCYNRYLNLTRQRM